MLDEVQPAVILRGHTAAVSSVAFAGGSHRVLSGSWDQSAILWDVKSAHAIVKLGDHDAAVSRKRPLR